MSAPSVSGNQPWLFVSIMFPGPRRNRICVSPGRPSAPEVRLPPPGQPHLFLLSVPVGLPGLPHRYPLWTLWTCISRQTGLSRPPLSPFGPCGLCRTSITCRSPFTGCPCRAGVSTLSLITLRPLRTRGTRFPFGPGGPTTVGIRFTASSAAILLCSADCALSADSRAFSVAVVASLAALPAALSAVFLTTQHLLHFVMTHWLLSGRRGRGRDASSDCFAAAALSAACRADSDASPAEVSAFAALFCLTG